MILRILEHSKPAIAGAWGIIGSASTVTLQWLDAVDAVNSILALIGGVLGIIVATLSIMVLTWKWIHRRSMLKD